MGRKTAARELDGAWSLGFANAMASLSVLRSWIPLTDSETEVYAIQCARVPLALLEAASVRWLKEQNRFPTPHQLLEMCERVRLAKFAQLRDHYPVCGECSQDGWVEREVNGIKRAARCQCRTAFQQACERLGWPREPLALPAPESDVVAEG